MTTGDETIDLPNDRPAPGGSGASPPSAPAPIDDLSLGRVLAGRYRLVAELGRGGMGAVYRADDLDLGTSVALKFLPPEVADRPDRLERFRTEVRLAREVTHRHVCRVHDIVSADGHVFLSMEYVDGEDLASLLRRIGRLPGDKANAVARQLCLALAALHERGLIHRDLKPANVMIDGRGDVRLADFGVSAGVEEAAEGGLVGTPAYMAPEQLDGREATVRSDLYALGLLLHELYTGAAPYEAPRTLAEARDAARTRSGTTLADPSSLVADLDPAVERVILRCLEPEPDARPASAAAVLAALPGGDPLAAVLEAGETPSPELLAAAGAQQGSRPVVAIGVALAALAALVLAAVMLAPDSVVRRVPLEKPPAVYVDRVETILETLGYDEPLHAAPRDAAHGFLLNRAPLGWMVREIEPEGWDALFASDRLNLVSFWYRHGPQPLRPLDDGGPFSLGELVHPTNPPPGTPGEVYCSTDLGGRLRVLYVYPSFFTDADAAPSEASADDYDAVFELAGLDRAAFTEVVPRFQRLFATESQLAWTGYLPDVPEHEVRIEAGLNGGRVSLFAILWPWTVDALAAPIAPAPRLGAGQVISIVIGLAMFATAAVLAFRAIRAGRVDRVGGPRLAIGIFLLAFAVEWLRRHEPLATALDGIPPATFFALACWLAYLVIEPFARRDWPRLVMPWSRLVVRGADGWRDPIVGRSVLAGAAAGAGALVLIALVRAGIELALGRPPTPEGGTPALEALLGARYALATVVNALIQGVLGAFAISFLLVVGRRLLRSIPAAAALTVAVFAFGDLMVLVFGGGDRLAAGLEVVGFSIFVGITLRFGILSAVTALFVLQLRPLLLTFEPGTWRGGPADLALVVAAALLAYGAWAAIGDRRRSRPAVPRGA